MYIYQTMSTNFGYIDIILLGMIAGFIILRLRNILGRKTGHEPKVHPGFVEKKFNVPNNNIKDFKKIPIEERNSEELSHLEGLDENKNVKNGDIITINTNDSFIYSDSQLVGTIGINNLIIVVLRMLS